MTVPTLETLAWLDVRCPSWSHGQAADRACPLCDRTRQPVLRRPDGLPLSHCPGCGLWFVAAVIGDEEMGRFYSDYWGSFRTLPATPAGVRRFRGAAEAGAFRDIRLQRLDALLGGLPGRRIFEVGCGLGAFLVAAKKRGAVVAGQDLSRAACEFAREKMGVPVLHGSLEDGAREAGSPDAVVMIDVLEHLARPKEALESVRKMLPQGGLLLLWTPNGGAAGASLETARTWVGFRVDLDHHQYFSARTIARLCESGFWRIEHLESVGFPDLDGIGSGPKSAARLARLAAERLGSRIPGAGPFVRAVRTLGKELRRPGSRDERRGTYHLFAILRNVRDEKGSGGDGG